MIELFRAGGPVMYPLLLCSIVTIAVILERVAFWWRVSSGRDDVVQRVVAAADGGPPSEASGRLRIAAEREARQLESYLGILSTMVSLAPLLGIFGTVLGIMESFQFLEPSAATAPLAAKQGLARALLTTAFGLAVAMISLIAWKVFHQRVSDLRHQLEMRCSEVEVALDRSSGADQT